MCDSTKRGDLDSETYSNNWIVHCRRNLLHKNFLLTNPNAILYLHPNEQSPYQLHLGRALLPLVDNHKLVNENFRFLNTINSLNSLSRFITDCRTNNIGSCVTQQSFSTTILEQPPQSDKNTAHT